MSMLSIMYYYSNICSDTHTYFDNTDFVTAVRGKYSMFSESSLRNAN